MNDLTEEDFSPATPEQWRAAYEGKIADLAQETMRTSLLMRLVRTLWHVIEVESPTFNPSTGLPPDERLALSAVVDGQPFPRYESAEDASKRIARFLTPGADDAE